MTTELWLYGSVARGTHSVRSDLDVLAVGDTPIDPGLLERAVQGLPQSDYLSVRQYTWSEVEGMAAYGSLFLLHLRLEGRQLHPVEPTRRLRRMLATLPCYSLVDRDLSGFLESIDDVEWSLADGGDPVFELGVLATVIRHCSILACYMLGQPTFEVARSIPSAFCAVGHHALAEEATKLYAFRLTTARGYPIPVRPSTHYAAEWADRARDFVHRVGALHEPN
jgi:hypothetical protein